MKDIHYRSAPSYFIQLKLKWSDLEQLDCRARYRLIVDLMEQGSSPLIYLNAVQGEDCVGDYRLYTTKWFLKYSL